MSNVLVTGIHGFVGQHLAHELVSQGHDVIGLGREQAANADLAKIVTNYISCDLTNQEEVSEIPFQDIDAVINLAGLAAVGKSFDDPDLYMNVNVSVLSLMRSRIEQLGLKKLRILAVSTGAVYSSKQQMPLSETSETDEFSSPYAASKLAMEACAQEFRNNGYDCIVARPFNHIGPGQLGGFLLPDLFEKIKSSTNNQINVGNLQTERDYTDVRDVARAYIALATNKELQHDIYNVCTGRPISGERLLKTLLDSTGKTDMKVIVDEKLFRPSDSPILFGDSTRLTDDAGWHPTIPFEQSVADFVKWKTAS